MTVRLLVGDCRAMLATLPDASAHACVTSPPYYGLRAYGTNPQVWGGDPACGHSFGAGGHHVKGGAGQNKGLANGAAYREARDTVAQTVHTGAYCTRCGAWRGELGSEPHPEQYVANLVAVFREVKRVLHPSGVLICNLGDSYAGSGKGPTGHNGIQNVETRQGFTGTDNSGHRGDVWKGEGYKDAFRNSARYTGQKRQAMGGDGYKAKDLMQMPARVAMALQADGWYLRSVMPWLKRAAMPESVTDRPSNALEWLFLFSKAPRYFWDAEAIRQGISTSTLERWNGVPVRKRSVEGANWLPQTGEHVLGVNPAGRAFRNTDPWFLSLDAAIADARADLARLEAMRAAGGVLTDGEGLPLAVDVNPAAFAQAHFATYPPALVVPFVKAGTSERGACSRCLAPWTRAIETTYIPHANAKSQVKTMYGERTGGDEMRGALRPQEMKHGRATRQDTTTGWQPSCACDAGEPIPTTILDCFAGSGTTLLVADRLGRDAVGIELSEAYARMAEARIAGDAPLWVDMAEVETAANDYAPLRLFGEAAS